jgi:uncharacterized protein YdiU (UPF0061 family)
MELLRENNYFLHLQYETALENLGGEYYDEVRPAKFPTHQLRWRNNDVLTSIMGIDPADISDSDFILSFGCFQGRRPFLAMGYHGYQFGVYNPNIGDGRGFIYGQVRGKDNVLYDFGTKGSGTTSYSRGLDGRLTLKGGVRELIAAESLHYMGVNTSRCFCLIETGEKLMRTDEPSPTRSCVLTRFGKSHIRFGTFERLHTLKRNDLIERLLNHVIEIYYPNIQQHSSGERYMQFFNELVIKVARLVAQWMSEGFCHGVLNTDNMNINGESFDYGPYGFIHAYNPEIVSTSFDYYGHYRYGKQPEACKRNLEMLGRVLQSFIPQQEINSATRKFNTKYSWFYQHRMLLKQGIANEESQTNEEIDQSAPHASLLDNLIRLLHGTQVRYHAFFAELRKQFNPSWKLNPDNILSNLSNLPQLSVDPTADENQKVVARLLANWRASYCGILQNLPSEHFEKVPELLQKHNVLLAPTKHVIDDVCQAIYERNDWQPLYTLLEQLKQ